MNSANPTQPPIIPVETKSNARRPWVWFGLGVAAIAAIIIFQFDPSRSVFYPGCVFKKATGWSCPTCGCLRASHQLLHGHIATAFRLNALFVLALPVAALLVVQRFLQKPIIKRPAHVGWLLLVLFLVFGILRNLPPFLAWSGQ